MAKCQSLYAYCLRDTGQVDLAVEFCQQALTLRTEVYISAEHTEHKNIISLQNKLDGLMLMQQAGSEKTAKKK